MKPVTMYEANDGSRWAEAKDAEKRDALIVKCDEIATALGLRPRPSDLAFDNGGGYVQQPIGSWAALEVELRSLGAHRDSDGPIGRLLYRAHCMDASDREWGQPYFALNPDKGKQESR